VVIR
jgi:8-oxo-dGTP diphosphatase